MGRTLFGTPMSPTQRQRRWRRKKMLVRLQTKLKQLRHDIASERQAARKHSRPAPAPTHHET
jgi:hypothetical protein